MCDTEQETLYEREKSGSAREKEWTKMVRET